MSSNQPVWKLVANLGDVHPLDYGGYFVYVDETGVYPPEAEWLDVDNKDLYTIHRFTLERCTYSNGILSENKFHPSYPAWWAKPEEKKKERPQDTTYLSNICDCMDIEQAELIRLFCSEEPIERAEAYRCVGEYHGWLNLDHYPLTGLTREEVEKLYPDWV